MAEFFGTHSVWIRLRDIDRRPGEAGVNVDQRTESNLPGQGENSQATMRVGISDAKMP
jgi:hypothetical protein